MHWIAYCSHALSGELRSFFSPIEQQIIGIPLDHFSQQDHISSQQVGVDAAHTTDRKGNIWWTHDA